MNLLSPLPDATAGEVFDELVANRSCRIERIVSRGQASPDTGWYDQQEHEWLVVLKGAAIVLVHPDQLHHLGVGDTLLLPAHTRHRVTWTDPDQETVWLAVFFPD